MSLAFTVLSPTLYQGHSYLAGVRGDDNSTQTLINTKASSVVFVRPRVEDFHPQLLTYRYNSGIYAIDFKLADATLVTDKATFYSLFDYKDAFRYFLTPEGNTYKEAGVSNVIYDDPYLGQQIMLLNPSRDIIKLRLEHRKERDDDFFLKRDEIAQEQFRIVPETIL